MAACYVVEGVRYSRWENALVKMLDRSRQRRRRDRIHRSNVFEVVVVNEIQSIVIMNDTRGGPVAPMDCTVQAGLATQL